MGLLGNLLKKFRVLEVEDEFFGHLTYMKMPKGRISYWEAKRLFSPSGREIELFIDAPGPEQKPAELQRQFCAAVERKYSKILTAVESVLRPQFEEWTRKPLAVPLAAEFTMKSFSIPHAQLDVAQWDMSFESQSDANHLFTVALHGEVATAVTIDG